MSLIDCFVRTCEFLVPEETPDGQGGMITRWNPGKRFGAAFVKKSTGQIETGDKLEAAERYTVTVPTCVNIKHHDVFRRLNDRQIFRAVSNSDGSRPPECASFTFEQVEAERWELPE